MRGIGTAYDVRAYGPTPYTRMVLPGTCSLCTWRAPRCGTGVAYVGIGLCGTVIAYGVIGLCGTVIAYGGIGLCGTGIAYGGIGLCTCYCEIKDKQLHSWYKLYGACGCLPLISQWA
eukprot:1872606-Rhodomonas_salina.3